MKVSVKWLKDLVNYTQSPEELEKLLSLHSMATKEVTDNFFELDMKGYNRADLLSMRGVAYEVAAITDSKVTFEENDKLFWDTAKLPEAKVKVENPKLAPLYCIAKIEGLKVSKSPDTLVARLEDCGMRQVNNIADITNLIMLEYGQPLHAFDAAKIKDETLIVRCAKQNEEIITLDEKTRKLATTDLLITDPEKTVGIAGVMGGKNSEISDSTNTIFLEAAIFDPGNLRSTAQRLTLLSEASRRFQHGLTKKRALQAFSAAIKMYRDLGGKVTALTIVGNSEDKQKTIILDKSQMDSLIGIEILQKDVEKYLTQLNFKLASQGETLRAWKVIPPYYRLDIEIEADVIEEVARMYGYEKILPQPLAGKIPEKIDQSFFNNLYDLKVSLVEKGFTEVQTYSFFSTDVINFCEIKKSYLIKLSNPISAETEYMRNKLWPNLVEVTAKNIKQGIKQIAVFEIGKVYEPKEGAVPQETYKLAVTLSNSSQNTIAELWTLFQSLCSHMSSGKLTLKTDAAEFFHPARFAHVMDKNKEIGLIAEIHPRIVDKFGVNQRVSVLEIDLENFF